MCTLFSSHFNSPFVSKGFDKWKKCEKSSEHENSINHRSAFTKWLLHSNSNHSINKDICWNKYQLRENTGMILGFVCFL